MNIAICFDKNFQKWATVCLHSIWEQHKGDAQKIRLVILSDITYDQSIWQLKKVLEHFDFTFDNPGNELDSMPTSKQFSKAVYWRLVLPKILYSYGIERCLYLDVDTIAVKNFKELLSIDLNGQACGAVLDINSDLHVERLGLQQKFAVNSGILLMNVLKMVEYQWLEESNHLNNSGRITFFDQDLINVILDGDISLLDVSFNVQSGHFQNDYSGEVNIIHFTESSNTKPWNIKSKHLYMGVYNTYMRKSGFYFEYAWFELIRRIKKLSFLY